MKQLFSALLLVLCFTACQKEVTDTITGTSGPAGGASGSFTAMIDGVPWSATKGAFANFSPAGNGAPALLSIIGVGNDKKIMGLSLVDSGVHQYIFTDGNDGNYNAGYFQDSSLADVNSFASIGSPTQPSGTATVQTIDRSKKTVSGTFSFIAYRELDGLKRTITNGVFTNIPYTEGGGVPPASSKDTFNVTIDGTPFVPYSITGLSVGVTNSIAVEGSNQDGTKTVGLNFPVNITPGTYTLDIFGATYMALYNTGGGTLSSLSGTLKILEHNTATKRVRGNFAFKGEDISGLLPDAQLTNGYFSVTYQ